jgi:hypothetical protein
MLALTGLVVKARSSLLLKTPTYRGARVTESTVALTDFTAVERAEIEYSKTQLDRRMVGQRLV